MRRIAVLLASCALVLAGLGLTGSSTTPAAQASAGAYTWVKHTNASGLNKRIMVKCHLTQDWRTLYIGDASGQVCGQNGWVDSIWAIDGYAPVALNRNTGNYTYYQIGYKGPIGGGEYYIWLSAFCGGCGGGKHATHRDSQWGGREASEFTGGGGGGGGGGYSG